MFSGRLLHPKNVAQVGSGSTIDIYMYIRVVLGSLCVLGSVLYYVQIKNKNKSPSSLKLAGFSIVGALVSGIVLVGLMYKDAQVRSWPREYIAGEKPDFSKVPGVSPEQELWATTIAADTFINLKKWTEYSKALEDNYVPVSNHGDGDFVHVMNFKYIRDDRYLDPQYPESLLYKVKDNKYTLLAAMYMMRDIGIDDPRIKDIGGPLIQWHNHSDLIDGFANEKWANIHVWVTSNKCGVFAAADHPNLLGVASVPIADRVDICQ